jgi:uncharacterized membrane protein
MLHVYICLPVSELWYGCYSETYPERILRELFYTAGHVFFLPRIFCFMARTSNAQSNVNVNDDRNRVLNFLPILFWTTFYVFPYLLWKYSYMSRYVHERLYGFKLSGNGLVLGSSQWMGQVLMTCTILMIIVGGGYQVSLGVIYCDEGRFWYCN